MRRISLCLAGSLLAGMALGLLYKPAPAGHLRIDRALSRPAVSSSIPASVTVAEADELRAALPGGAPGQSTLSTVQLERNGRQVEVVAGVALVKPADAAAARAYLSRVGSRVMYQSPSGYWRVSVPGDIDLKAFLERLERQSVFAAAQPEGVVRACSLADGTIKYDYLQWNLDQMHWDDVLDQDEVELDDLARVTVAVIDSGVAYEDRTEGDTTYVASPDLAGSSFVHARDFVDDDSHAADLAGHGTHIANIIAADGGTLGVAPHVRIMPLRVLDGENAGTELALVDAVLHAVDHGADVINMSLSFSPGYIPGEALADAVQSAEDEDIVVVASSGNLGEDEVSYPAAYADVIAVGASRLTAGDLSWVTDYTNTGTALDVVAPGGAGDLDVNDDGKPDAIIAQSIEPGNPSVLHYYLMAGTSQAAAHVSGAAAWLVAAGANAEEARQAIINTSVGTWGRRYYAERQGIGIVNVAAALNAYLADSSSVNEDARYYVNVLPLMLDEGDTVSPVGLFQVIDAAGRPAPNVLLAGHWSGSLDAAFAAVTNSDGQAWISVNAGVDADSAAIFGLQVDRVVDRSSRTVAPAAVPFYYVSGGLLHSLIGWSEDTRVAGSRLLFSVEPDTHGLPSWVASSYVAKAVGAVDGFGPAALTFNARYLEGLVTSSTPVDVVATFSEPQAFSWGTETEATLRLVDATSAATGESVRFGITPLDLAMFYGELTTVMPVLNSSSADFNADNASFRTALGTDALGYGTGPGLFGDQLYSTFGDQLYSTFGDQLYSTFGDQLYSTFGDQLYSTFGDQLYSTFGDSVSVELAGSSIDAAVMVAANYDDGTGDASTVEESETGFGADYIGITPDL